MAGDWEETTLADVSADVAYGYTESASDEKVGPRFLRITDIQNGVVDWHTVPYCPISESDHRKYRLHPGDIVVARTGNSTGENYLYRGTEDAVYASYLIRFRVNQRAADPAFVWYNMRTQWWQDFINSSKTGSAQAGANAKVLGLFPLTLPPLAEQKAIAAVLGALDDKIELNRRMNATLEAMARALFQSWFVDFDPVRAKLDGRVVGSPLPVGEGQGEGFCLDPATAALFPEHLEDSPLGHIPKGWTAGKLGDIGTNSRRGVQPGDIAPNTPYIALEHMPRRCIALGDWDDSADVASGKSAFRKGEILFGKLRPYFHKVGVAPFDGVCSTDILVLAPKTPEWFGFLLGHASSDELIQFTDLASTGTKMPRTNWGDISSFKAALPPKPIAAAFTRNVQPMLDRIHANLHQSRTLATLRDTLLPKLLSGEMSVGEVESKREATQ
jgi:type I restriction enzyme S subunit